jgi:hypothetical protein
VDRRLREAQRAGDPVALLHARARAGELTQEHVELAASLGHRDARAACPGRGLVSFSPGEQRTQSIVAARVLLGETLPARIAADWAERVLPHWDAEHPGDNRSRRALAVTRAWVACPCGEHRNAALAGAAVIAEAPRSAAARAVRWAALAAASSSAKRAVVAACSVADLAVGLCDSARAAEREWQRLRLAAYVLGDEPAV